MPPALPNDQELSLKKRARRRLVGAIALVLLMVVILPMVLQDRAALSPQDAIKITMPEASKAAVDTSASNPAITVPVEIAQVPPEVAMNDESVGQNATSVTTADDKKVNNVKSDAESKSGESKNLATKVEKKSDTKESVTKLTESKPSEASTETKAQQKSDGSFAIQVGVYSDAANVKQLQAKLKDGGYVSHTEKISTPKGEKIRLRVGSYPSRQAAADALVKLKDSGLTGMVISND